MNNELNDTLQLLESLIRTPSFSREEEKTAGLISAYLSERGVDVNRKPPMHNVWAFTREYDPERPTLLLNSHHDTVRPAEGYTFDPFAADRREGCVYGLGSNDAGASVVSLIAAFLRLKNKALPFNLMLAITAEEEVGGEHGMRAFLSEMCRRGVKIDMAIVGEPTGMQPAIGERGLLVLDCVTHGVAGHAARNEGVNALYKALDDINRLRNYKFGRRSELLGEIAVSVTQIEAGCQHNVVPDVCRYVVDVRTTDAYSPEETIALLRSAVNDSELKERSTRVRPSVISADHPLVQSAVEEGLTPFVSLTTSDMSLMYDIPSLKIGPGDSSRSHRADEYIRISEIEEAINLYEKLILKLAGYF